ncbi:MAG: hypothetical protein ACTSVE_01800 [Candidatus Helarchaeota archaeon]
MSLKKYAPILMGLVISIIIFVLITILGIYAKEIENVIGHQIIPPEYVFYFVYILPGTIFTDVPLLYGLNILFFFLFLGLAVPVTLLWVRLHKLMSFKRKKYGILELGSEIKPSKLFYRAFIISLFTFSISTLIIQAGYASLFRVSFVPSMSKMTDFLLEAEGLFLCCFFMTPFILLIFFPIWALEDVGLVSCRIIDENERRAPDIEGVHSIFLNILQGYAGFSTILNLISYISRGFMLVPITSPAILTPLILLLLPFILTGLFTAPILLYEKFLPKLKEKMHPKLEELGFVKIKMPDFDELKI